MPQTTANKVKRVACVRKRRQVYLQRRLGRRLVLEEQKSRQLISLTAGASYSFLREVTGFGIQDRLEADAETAVVRLT
ncbi:hypothetical protein V5799_018629 [Amblyomma americanum]|uniref:Uncharacterized protein n=1 Tax=Amblyomma americanum TaxID=6943 RepID=A0AAQ4EZZ3_AMBAM